MIDTQALRKKILDAAIRGKLTKQLPEDGNAEDLYKEIQAEKQRLIKEGMLKKEKPLPEIEANEIPFEIPKNWKWVRLGSIFNMQAGKNITAKMISANKADETPYLCYGGNGLRGFVSSWNTEGYHVLIGRQGALCGNVKKASGKFYATEHAVVVTGFCSPCVNWQYYFLTALNLNQYSMATAQPGLAVEKINAVLIPLPPVAEQKRIASKIETLFAHLNLIDQNQKKLSNNSIALRSKLIELGIKGELTEQLAEDGNAEDLYKEIQAEKQRLIKEGKIKKEKPLPEITEDEIPFDIPEKWKWVRLNAVGLDFADGPFGSNLKKEHYTDNPEVRIIQLSNIGEYGWRDENVKFTTYKHLDLIIRSKVDPGDIVVAKMMPAGRAIIVPELGTGFVLSSDAIKVVPSAYIDVRFLLYAINSNVFRDQIYSEVQGTTRVRTSLAKVRGYLIPLPPLAEQKRIVEKLEQLLPLCDSMSKDIAEGDAV